MCTAIVRFDPGGEWPVLLAFVRDEDRIRETQPPGFWWSQLPTVVGGRDARAGGTWLAVDVGDGEHATARVAFVQNQIGPHVTLPGPGDAAPSRGQLPLAALQAGAAPVLDDEAQLRKYHPFHLVSARLDGPRAPTVDWWQWSGQALEHVRLQPGMHLIASRGVGMPGERERRAEHLARFAQAGAPDPRPDRSPEEAWGSWLQLLDGRDAQPDRLDGIVVHSVGERPGFGTVGASLVGLAADGGVRYDVNDTTTIAPERWRQVDVTSASVPAR